MLFACFMGKAGEGLSVISPLLAKTSDKGFHFSQVIKGQGIFALLGLFGYRENVFQIKEKDFPFILKPILLGSKGGVFCFCLFLHLLIKQTEELNMKNITFFLNHNLKGFPF